MIRHLLLNEGDPACEVELSDAEARVLAELELATVARLPGGNEWRVEAGTKVGVVRMGELQVTVQPKLPIERLVFMIGYARQPSHWRAHSVELEGASDLVEALAEAFRRLSTKATEQGLLNGYVEVDDALPLVRGRIRVADQMSRRYNLGIPLEVRYDDFTVDIAENRLLLSAALVLLRNRSITPTSRRSLQRLRLQLADVTPVRSGEPRPRWRPTRLNTRYHSALRLADVILGGDSFEQRIGDLEVSGFVLSMWTVYEDFVCVALREAMAPYGGIAQFQSRTSLDVADSVTMKPDIVWLSAGLPIAVADAKYKAEKYDGFANADLYQMLAYCVVLGLGEGHLIYARGNEAAREVAVKRAGVRLHCHALDLDGPPTALLKDIRRVADRIAAGAPTFSPVSTRSTRGPS